MVFGSFDQLHPGHMYFLKEAKKLGKDLIVILARDENIKKLKGNPKYSEKERKQHLETTGIPDKVINGKLNDWYTLIETHNPDIICLGYDQDSYNLDEELKKRNLKAKVIRLKAFKEHIFKSSKLK